MSIHNQNISEYINRVNMKFSNNNNDETFNELVMNIDLDDNNKKIFIRRVSEIIINNKKKCKIYNAVLITLRYILQIFSAVLTFTLSINSLTTIPYLNYINLAILFILTLTTNIYFQSKLGEKYITIKKSYNKVVKELWAYITVSGAYSGKSHQENLTLFYNTIDKIIEQENNAVINIDREIDRTMSSGSGNGNNNIPKMKLGNKNDKHNHDEGVAGVAGVKEGDNEHTIIDIPINDTNINDTNINDTNINDTNKNDDISTITGMIL